MNQFKVFLKWLSYNLSFVALVFLAGTFGFIYYPICIGLSVITLLSFLALMVFVIAWMIPIQKRDAKVDKAIKNTEELLKYNNYYFLPNLIIDVSLVVYSAYFAGTFLACILTVLFILSMMNVKMGKNIVKKFKQRVA
jgi:Na+-transporting methylmalonyl-CoA/oxaloacetate decarboxylase gamma subunit